MLCIKQKKLEEIKLFMLDGEASSPHKILIKVHIEINKSSKLQ